MKCNTYKEYSDHVSEIIDQLKKKTKKAQKENSIYLVDPVTAKEKYNGKCGQTFYLFKDDAPSQDVIKSFNELGYNQPMEYYLFQRGTSVMFIDGDLVCKIERPFLYIETLTEKKFNAYLDDVNKNIDSYNIDWDNAKIFIFPFKSRYFYISDSFEQFLGGGRSDLRNPKNWFCIDYNSDVNYKDILGMCHQFEKENDIQNETTLSFDLELIRQF